MALLNEIKKWLIRTFIVLISFLFFTSSSISVSANSIGYEQTYRNYSFVDLKFSEKPNSTTSQNLKDAVIVLRFTCKSQQDLVDYRIRGAGVEVVAAKEVGTHLVYQGFNKAGVVKYVGITVRNATVRFGEHLSTGTAKSLLRYEVVPGATNLSMTGARVWEQTLINQHGLNNLLNVRNSIARKYWFQYGIKP